MKRRLPFIIFVAVLLAIGGVIYFLQGGGNWREIPVISNAISDEPAPAEQTADPTPAAFDMSAHSLDDPTSPWVVVNKQRALSPLTYAPVDLVSAGGGQQLRADAAAALAKMFDAARAESLTLDALSGYRSYSRQQTIYSSYVAEHGETEANTFSAKPGYSEHQTGWAIDIGGGGCGIEACFGDTAHGKWVAAHAHEYGFIIRYPEGKQAVTGYIYEPWHIRYVGIDLATEMREQSVATLEEFFDL